MKKIDAHLHVAKVIAGYCRRGEFRTIGGGKAQWANGDIVQLIPEQFGLSDSFPAEKAIELFMDENEIEKAILMNGSLWGFQNMYHYELMQKYPDRFCGSCSVDPFMSQHMEILDRFLGELKFHLVKFEVSQMGGLMGANDPFDLSGDRMMEIFKLIEKYKGVVALDVGDIMQESFQPLALYRAAERCPDLKFVICHLLAPKPDHLDAWRASLRILKKDNIWFDISSVPKEYGVGAYPWKEVGERLAEAKDILGAKRMMWGTDAPFAIALTGESYGHLTDYLTQVGPFTEEELPDVYYNNAHKVFFEK